MDIDETRDLLLHAAEVLRCHAADTATPFGIECGCADVAQRLDRLRASLLARHRDGERADWWEAETRRVLQAVWAEGTDTTERVTRLVLNLRPANEQTPPPSVRDRVREERETIPSAPPSPERASK